MPDYPPEALFAAAAVIDRALMSLPCYAEFHPDSDVELARAALDAAAPFLAEAVAGRILEHMERYFPAGQHRGDTPRRWLRAGAQIAAGAFSSEAEMKRQAAEALAAGNYVACDLGEDGQPKVEVTVTPVQMVVVPLMCGHEASVPEDEAHTVLFWCASCERLRGKKEKAGG